MISRTLRAPWRKLKPAAWLLSEPLPAFDATTLPVLNNPDDLHALSPRFVRHLDDLPDIPAFDGRWCPVQFEDDSAGVLALAECVALDQVQALLLHLAQLGYTLSPVSRLIVAPALLLAIVRGEYETGSDVPASTSELRSALHAGRELSHAFHDIVAWGVRHGASDIHLNVRTREDTSEIRFSLSGRYLAPSRFHRLSTTMLLDMLSVAWMDVTGGNGALFDPSIEQQGALVRQVDGRDVLLRWSSLSADAGPSVCLRILLRDHVSPDLTLDSLGYLPDQVALIERVMQAEGGAIVLAGTVGSGKSTTLARLMARLPSYRKLISLEDPVEYLIAGAIQVTLARNLGVSAHEDFAAKLRALKRSGMTDVLLGEIRDAETGRAFMDLVGSGVNVYTTVHAPSARSIPDRLTSDFIGVSRDFCAGSGVFRMLVYQALLPRLCAACALSATDVQQPEAGLLSCSEPRSWLQWLELIQQLYGQPAQALRIRNTQGCDQCQPGQDPSLFGYAGRTVVAEIIEPLIGLHQQRSAMDCAVGKAFAGHIDPRDIEPRFHAFETERLRREALASGQHSAWGARA